MEAMPASGVEREVFMFSVLMRAFSFTLIIIIGIVMKSTGFVPKDAGASVKKFLIYVTLPASIITNFSAIEDMGFNMLIIAALGILLNVIMIAVGATDHTQKIQRRTGVKYALSSGI